MSSSPVYIQPSVSYKAKITTLLETTLDPNIILACCNSIERNDKAHNLEHIYRVCREGIRLLILLNKTSDTRFRDIVLYGCLMHDLGCKYDRDNHHLISYGMVFEYFARYGNNTFDMEMIKAIAQTVLEHRASSDLHPTSEESVFVRLADQGQPDIDLYIRRAYDFRVKNKLVCLDQITKEIINHLHNKFDKEGGYNWLTYPRLGIDLYEKEWDAFHEKLKDDNYIISKIKALSEENGEPCITSQ